MLRKPVLVVLLMALLAGSFMGGLLFEYQGEQSAVHNAAIAQMDHDQAAIYNATIHAAIEVPVNTTVTPGSSHQLNQTDYVQLNEVSTVSFFVEIFYSSAGHGTSVNQTLLSQGFTPDCVQRCSTADGWINNGINYYKDPVVITNQGHGVEQCSVFQGTGVTDTCTTTNKATYEGWSSKLQSGQTVNATDTWAGTHQSCSTGGGGTYLIVDGNGLRDVAAVVTAGANGATVSTSLAKTFSITGTYTAVQVACLLSGTGTNADSGTNPLIYAEATFGPDTFHSGDSITGVWQISRT